MFLLHDTLNQLIVWSEARAKGMDRSVDRTRLH
jgi:hypothetical protein